MSWFKNLQDQITDLANEVLTEATEETEDPETELNVAKKKCAEAEKNLAIETSKSEGFERKIKELEQQLVEAHVEMDTIASKNLQIVADRENEIKKLKALVERLNDSQWNASDDTLQQQLSDAQKEAQHWKRLVESGENIALAEHERILDEIKIKREQELAAIMEQNNEALNELRDMYEEKLQALQLCATSSSTSNADMLDAVMLEKEELLEEKKKLEEMIRSGSGSETGSEKAVLVDVGARDDLIDERLKIAEEDAERLRKEKLAAEKVSQDLREQNQELLSAYNELNQEFEDFKKQETPGGVSNSELHRRLDGMRANLIEYEERYETCIREHTKTVSDLERLQEKFDLLKTKSDECHSQQSDATNNINNEVERMREALEQSRTDRETLCADVQKFTKAIQDIGEEVDSLRRLNETLREENDRLHSSLETYRKTTDDLITDKEVDIESVREEIQKIREHKMEEIDALQKQNEALVEENESLKAQYECATKESDLLKKVREKLMQQSENDKKRVELFEEKIGLLESLQKQHEENLNEAQALVEDLQAKVLSMTNELQVKGAVYERLEKAKKSANLELEPAPVALEEGEVPSEELVLSLKKEVANLKNQLKELLAGFNEVFTEVETLRNENRGLEKEVSIRQSCVDEMIEQTNTLQVQRQAAAHSINDLRAEILLKTQEYLKLEQSLFHEKEHTEELLKVIKNMEAIIIGETENGEESEEKDVEQLKRNVKTMKSYIEKLKANSDEQDATIEELNKRLAQSMQTAETTKANLESRLRDAEHIDRGLLESLEERVRSMENDLSKTRTERQILMEENEFLKGKYQEEIEQLKNSVQEKSQACEQLKERLNNDPMVEQLKKELEKVQEATKQLIEHLGDNLKQLQAQFEAEKEVNKRKERELSELELHYAQAEAEIEERTVELEFAARENERLKKELEQQHQQQATPDELEQLRAMLAEATRNNEELQAAVVQKHAESVEYYNQLSATLAKCAEFEQQIQQNHGTSEALEKKTKELQRLKEHLVIVEDSSTKEAVEAELRETELRKRVAELESGKQAVEVGSKSSHEALVNELTVLKEHLAASQEKCTQLQTSLNSEIKMREQTQEALTSLQGVVRELSKDHESEASESVHKNLELQTQIQKLNEIIADVRAELERQSLGRQSAEDDVEKLKKQMESKEKFIEDLEVQLEDARTHNSSAAKSSSYRIDDDTLRQLFSNLFLSEASKKADIATLLASILEYPPEQMGQITKGVSKTFGQTTGFFGSPGQRGGGAAQGSSLTEQFIRFLEVESESSRTAPHLPIRSDAPRQQQFDLHSTRSSPTPKPSESTSSTTLDSILR